MVGRARWGFRCKDRSVRLVGLFHMGGTVTLSRYEGVAGKEDEAVLVMLKRAIDQAVVMWNLML